MEIKLDDAMKYFLGLVSAAQETKLLPAHVETKPGESLATDNAHPTDSFIPFAELGDAALTLLRRLGPPKKVSETPQFATPPNEVPMRRWDRLLIPDVPPDTFRRLAEDALASIKLRLGGSGRAALPRTYRFDKPPFSLEDFLGEKGFTGLGDSVQRTIDGHLQSLPSDSDKDRTGFTRGVASDVPFFSPYFSYLDSYDFSRLFGGKPLVVHPLFREIDEATQSKPEDLHRSGFETLTPSLTDDLGTPTDEIITAEVTGEPQTIGDPISDASLDLVGRTTLTGGAPFMPGFGSAISAGMLALH